MKATTQRNLLIILLTFLGLGAFCGGAILVISPSGDLFGMPLSLLAKSPFVNFLVPGLLLFLFLGMLPLLLVIPLLNKTDNKFAERLNFYKDMHWSWSFSIYTAFILIIWIQMEMMFLGGVHWSHTFYMFLAIAIISVALLPQVRNLYKR